MKNLNAKDVFNDQWKRELKKYSKSELIEFLNVATKKNAFYATFLKRINITVDDISL